jgi:galactonate dehydratase
MSEHRLITRRHCLPLAFGMAALPGSLAAAPAPLKITRLVTRKFIISGRDYLFLEIETDGGITGLGEGSLPGRAAITEQAIRWLEPHLIGLDPAGIDDHWNRIYHQLSRWRDGSVMMTALAAVDIALWDLEAKRLGVPVWRLAGASSAKPLPVYYSHWSQDVRPRTPAALKELAIKTREQGWKAVKWVVPQAATERERLEQAVAECRAVREAGLDFGLELWEKFTVRSAIEFARAVAPFNPLFIEEPVLRESPQSLAEVAAASPVPVATGEGLLTRYDFRHLLDHKGARIIQPDVVHCGGITEIRRIASLGETYGVEISPHMWYGPVAHAASIHAMSSVRNFWMQEWDAVHDRLFVELTRGTHTMPKAGAVTPSSQPGLGIEMDWVQWEGRFPYTGQATRRPGGR